MRSFPDKEFVSEMRSWFNSYTGAFRYDDHELQQNIDIKRGHTERVAKEIINIGKQLGLGYNELILAVIIGLFHDIGRFEQYDRYKTFSDHKSEDHAELGIKILKRYNILGMLDAKIQQLVFCSIKYHNKPSLPSKETKTCLFYARLIRDADKLDIWKLVTDYYNSGSARRNVAMVLELPDTPGISEEVYNALLNKHIVDMKFVKNINDIKLLQAGLIYDINFKPTFEFIKNRKYMESLRDTLPKTMEITKIFNIINSYIEDNCGRYFRENSSQK